MYANGFLFSPFETGSEMYKSLQVVYNDLRKSGNEELNNKLNKYIELGIVKQSASIGELRDMFKDANWSKAVESRLNNEATGIKNFTLKAARAIGRVRKTFIRPRMTSLRSSLTRWSSRDKLKFCLTNLQNR